VLQLNYGGGVVVQNIRKAAYGEVSSDHNGRVLCALCSNLRV